MLRYDAIQVSYKIALFIEGIAEEIGLMSSVKFDDSVFFDKFSISSMVYSSLSISGCGLSLEDVLSLLNGNLIH